MRLLLVAVLALSVFQCKSPEDVNPSERNTLVKFFGSSTNSLGSEFEILDDGLIIVSSGFNDTLQYLNLINTDQLGNILWQQQYASRNGKDIKVNEDGYLVIGDSIKIMDNTEQISSIYVAQTNNVGDITGSITIGDANSTLNYYGKSILYDNAGNIIITGTRETVSANLETLIIGLNGNLSIAWQQVYQLSNSDLEVGRSILSQSNTNNFVWTSSSRSISGEYISMQVTSENSENINSQNFGQNSGLVYSAMDLVETPIGFGIIGTTSEGGSNNIFFLRSTFTGDIIENTALTISTMIDGAALTGNDHGGSLVATSDGNIVLMGSISTTTEIGNGGTDVYLLKIDLAGNPLWESIIGGSGNESGKSIKEDANGNLVIIGTNELQGVSTTMLLRTNSKGELIE